jgi:hypothetical protein
MKEGRVEDPIKSRERTVLVDDRAQPDSILVPLEVEMFRAEPNAHTLLNPSHRRPQDLPGLKPLLRQAVQKPRLLLRPHAVCQQDDAIGAGDGLVTTREGTLLSADGQ